jgi:hypothetical protein
MGLLTHFSAHKVPIFVGRCAKRNEETARANGKRYPRGLFCVEIRPSSVAGIWDVCREWES